MWPAAQSGRGIRSTEQVLGVHQARRARAIPRVQVPGNAREGASDKGALRTPQGGGPRSSPMVPIYQEDSMAPTPGPSVFLPQRLLPIHPGYTKQSRTLEAQPRGRLSLGSAVGQSHHGLQRRCKLSTADDPHAKPQWAFGDPDYPNLSWFSVSSFKARNLPLTATEHEPP